MTKPFCKKCFLGEIDFEEVFQKITEIRDSLPEEIRADERLYKERLDICEKCGSLSAGICQKCGCYVLLRAAKKNMRCPHENHFW